MTVLCTCVCVSVAQAAGPPRGTGAAGAEGLSALVSPPGRGAELARGDAGVEVKRPAISFPSHPLPPPPSLQDASWPAIKSALFPF